MYCNYRESKYLGPQAVSLVLHESQPMLVYFAFAIYNRTFVQNAYCTNECTCCQSLVWLCMYAMVVGAVL